MSKLDTLLTGVTSGFSSGFSWLIFVSLAFSGTTVLLIITGLTVLSCVTLNLLYI